jgi:hypothetical protein
MGRIAEAIAAGLPVECVQVGMMIGSLPDYWPVDVCGTYMAAIVSQWPAIGGAYLWAGDKGSNAAWAAKMAGLL